MNLSARRPLCVLAVAALSLTASAASAQASSLEPPTPGGSSHACGAGARVVGFSDALDQAAVDGTPVGGLSDLAYDARRHAWASTVDNHADDPARLWFFSDRRHPHPVGQPLVLKAPDGTPYTGKTADHEGLAVLPDGDYLITSETEPTVRVFGRDGVQKSEFPMPARVGVAGRSPQGEATDNATLEGLALSPDGRTAVASMEGALSGDSTPADATAHRLLVYRQHGHQWRLEQQLAYRTEAGNRIPEVQFYGPHSLLVEEAAWNASTGNTVQLYAVPDLRRAPDVSAVEDLAQAPASAFLHKTEVVDVNACPSLGAPARQAQQNPLMDNYEGMAVTGGRHGTYRVTLISDNNFNPQQVTRVLNLDLRLPRARMR